ncbi:phenylalanyl-tRNA synthetase beta subunit [Centipeda periodontii DSM 2778]|uniref:Phenylalanyl-tRNA synthetase beta subunit n=1 Tax=Centipeda periodontii DSM 2778 TaxID=888060 RepID=F5RJR1_9FIRM|nr:phenylalanyl-tRNA synthetase beta subunit [Centipeda periodontii DSM 2778]
MRQDIGCKYGHGTTSLRNAIVFIRCAEKKPCMILRRHSQTTQLKWSMSSVTDSDGTEKHGAAARSR